MRNGGEGHVRFRNYIDELAGNKMDGGQCRSWVCPINQIIRRVQCVLLTNWHMCIWRYRELLDDTFGSHASSLEMSQHLFRDVLWRLIRCSHLDSMVLCLVCLDRMDVGGDLTVLQLRQTGLSRHTC